MGVKTSYNISTFKSDINGLKYLSEYHFGAILEIKASEKLSVQPEFSIGYKFEIKLVNIKII